MIIYIEWIDDKQVHKQEVDVGQQISVLCNISYISNMYHMYHVGGTFVIGMFSKGIQAQEYKNGTLGVIVCIIKK